MSASMLLLTMIVFLSQLGSNTYSYFIYKTFAKPLYLHAAFDVYDLDMYKILINTPHPELVDCNG